MWLVFAVLGHIINAFVFITDKAFVQKLYPSPSALAFIGGASGVFTFIAFPWLLKPAEPIVLAAAVAAGALFVPALLLFFKALQRDEVSRVVPAIGSMTPPFTFALSYGILGERLEPIQLVAFSVLAFGGILLAFHSFDEIFRRRFYALFFLELLVAFLFAFDLVLQKFAFVGTDDLSAFLWSRIGAVGVALPLLLSKEVRSRLKFSELRGGRVGTGALYIASRIFAGLAPLIILLAISFGSATLVNSLQGIQYALLFVLAIFFSKRWPQIFREELTRNALIQKAMATILIVIGLALLV